jgi:hypothetical protein
MADRRGYVIAAMGVGLGVLVGRYVVPADLRQHTETSPVANGTAEGGTHDTEPLADAAELEETRTRIEEKFAQAVDAGEIGPMQLAELRPQLRRLPSGEKFEAVRRLMLLVNQRKIRVKGQLLPL